MMLRTLGQAILQETALDELETQDPLKPYLSCELRYPVYRRLAQTLAERSCSPKSLTAEQWEQDMKLPREWASAITRALALVQAVSR